MAAPNGQNGKGKFVFAITKMSASISLFRHFSSTGCSTASNAPRGRAGCIVNERPCERKSKKIKNHPDLRPHPDNLSGLVTTFMDGRSIANALDGRAADTVSGLSLVISSVQSNDHRVHYFSANRYFTHQYIYESPVVYGGSSCAGLAGLFSPHD
jgi:hypothetical protein